MAARPPPRRFGKKDEKPKSVWLSNDPSSFGEVFKFKHGKSLQVLHGVKFSPKFNLLWVGFSSDGHLLCTSSEDFTARVFDVATASQRQVFEHAEGVRCCSFGSYDTQLCTASLDGFARVWDVESGKLVKRIDVGKYCLSACLSPDARFLLTGSWDKFARVYFAEDWEELVYFKYDDEVRSVGFSVDGQRICTACGGGIVRVHVTPEPPEKIPEGEEPPPGPKMIKLELEKMKIEQLKNRLRVRELSDRGKKVDLIDRLKACGGDETPEDPPPDPRRELARFVHVQKVDDVRFSPHGEWLVTCCRDKHARIFHIETGQIMALFPHGNWVNTAFFLGDRSVMCTACEDGFVRVFDLVRQQEIIALECGGPATCAAFRHDGALVAAASRCGSAHVFGVLAAGIPAVVEHGGDAPKDVTGEEEDMMFGSAVED
eukprot:TRINITY_DN74786_c0_g1_i1.p1 TRINITY_DN74786_c0_g1~~TRINITY_DN74786_c0_g1_i1.p1  ORF type:complete len:430 (+),score=81.91 TRINITY_DN74786_c0_g1_i1:198-1487(+)